jgi:sugar fermentation stimulation protein A
MRYSAPLVRGELLKRYKRFFADVRLADGRVVVAHCPNSGTMKTCADPGVEVALTPHDDPARKLQYTWELTKAEGGWIGVNTMRPNVVASEAIAAGVLPTLKGYPSLRREVKYGANSRIDVLLEGPQGRAWVEVKNVTLKDGRIARFPDAVTERGLKHLEELTKMRKAGDRAVMLFFMSRPDCDLVSVARDIDPDYAAGLKKALKAGVEAIAAKARATLTDLEIVGEVPCHFDA